MIPAIGLTIDEMRSALLATNEGQKLYERGDCILVWMNEGDYCNQMLSSVAATQLNYYKSVLAEADKSYDALQESLDSVDWQQQRRDELAAILEQIAAEGLPHPRHLDAALDAIYTLILGN